MFKLEVLTLILIIGSFGLKKKHSLTVLLSLEFLSLLIIVMTFMAGLDLFFGLIIICIGACEGAVGLRALIRMTRMKSDQAIEV
jgi:NADH:ubiquinone oxidoreductase subunit K